MWYQVQVDNSQREEVENLSEALEETGALSVTFTDKHDDPVLEPEPGTTPLWPEIIIHALYNEKDAATKAMDALAKQYPHLQLSLEAFADQDWERAWMDDFKPQRFGHRLWICPSWTESPDPDAVNLILDPGLAFGTGTHPTTSLCLNWLDQAELNHKVIIDYGCGSGILALAALKLGASEAYAVDIDEQALQATRNNALTNQIAPEKLHVHFPDELNIQADLLIANILLTPLISLKDRFRELVNKDGLLVVSGILADQETVLTEHYQDDFKLQLIKNMHGWSLLVFSRC
nr:50S ribosomal protein L11 methyltransferase [Legionella jordanis]